MHEPLDGRVRRHFIPSRISVSPKTMSKQNRTSRGFMKEADHMRSMLLVVSAVFDLFGENMWGPGWGLL